MEKLIFWYRCHLAWQMVVLFVDNCKANCLFVGMADLEFNNFELDIKLELAIYKNFS